MDQSAYNREWRRKNKDKVRAYEHQHRGAQALRQVARRVRQRESVFAVLGHTCARCGFTDKRALQFDHINGGGSQDFAQRQSSKAYFQSIIDRPGQFQVLCANCNSIKRVEQGAVGLKVLSIEEWSNARQRAEARGVCS